MPHNARKPSNIRLCPIAIGAAKPHRTLTESRIVQTAIENKSTDPKKSGARINTTMVVQSWIELNIATENSDLCRWHHRDGIVAFSLNLPLGLDGRVHVGHCVCRAGHCGCRVVDEQQELVVVHDLGIGDVHHILDLHLESRGEQHTRWIAQVEVIDRRYRFQSKSRGVDAELLQEV